MEKIQATVQGVGPLWVWLYFDRADWPAGDPLYIGFRGLDIRTGGNIDQISYRTVDGIFAVRLWCGSKRTFSNPGMLSISHPSDVAATKRVYELEFVFAG